MWPIRWDACRATKSLVPYPNAVVRPKKRSDAVPTGPRSRMAGTHLGLQVRGGLGRELDPDPVGILDESEAGVALGERREGRLHAARHELPIRRVRVVAVKRKVVQLVTQPVGVRGMLRALRIPVKLEELWRVRAHELGPLTARLGYL